MDIPEAERRENGQPTEHPGKSGSAGSGSASGPIRPATTDRAGLGTPATGAGTGRAILRRAVFLARELGDFLYIALRGLYDENLPRMASSLSYTSLLALVPLVAIALAVLAAFPAFDQARDEMLAWVFSNLVPYQAEAIREQLQVFVNAAGGLTALGVVGLAATAVLLLNTVETALNTIFEVRTQRNPVSRILMYWAVLTIGPLLSGASFSLSSYVMAMSRWAGEGVASSVNGVFAVLGPHLLTWLAMTLLFVFVPNRPVRLRHAVIGALVTTVLTAILRETFLIYVTSARTYQTLYGALALLPLFLVWMYASWMVVLAGAVTAAQLPNWQVVRRLRRTGVDEHGQRLGLAVAVLLLLTRAFGRHDAAVGRAALLRDTHAADTRLSAVLETLRGAGLVTHDDAGYRIGRDPRAIPVADVVRALGMAPPAKVPLVLRNDPAMWTLGSHLEKADAHLCEALAITVDDLARLPEENRGRVGGDPPSENTL